MSSCRLFKAVGLVNKCGDESPTVPEQEPSSGEQELGKTGENLYTTPGKNPKDTTPGEKLMLQVGDNKINLTSYNGKFSTHITSTGFYIINIETKKKNLVHTFEKKLNIGLFTPRIFLSKKDLYILGVVEELFTKEIIPLITDDTCKINTFVRLTDYGVLTGSCGTYNK